MNERICLSIVFIAACLSGCPSDSSSGSKPAASGTGSKQAQKMSGTCGGSCSADVDAGNSSFAAGDYAEAFEHFKCANTPESAFGAGLSKLLNALETPAADNVMQDFGQPHFSGGVFLGPDSLLSRSSKRWNGEGALSLSGGRTLDVTFTRVLAGLDDEEIKGEADQDDTHIVASVATYQQPVPGVYPVAYDCATGNRIGMQPPDVNVTLTEAGHEYECQIAWAAALGSACSADGGSVNVVALGSGAGQPVRMEFTNTRLECMEYDYKSDEQTGTLFVVIANGHLAATLTENVDLRELHPIFEMKEAQIGAQVTLGQMIEHAAPMADDFAQAGCFFDKAASGKGTVFTLPGVSFGGRDLPLTGGDAKIFASAAIGAAGLLQLARAFPIESPLREVACWLGSDLNGDPGDDVTAGCPTKDAFYQGANAAVMHVKVQREPLDAARYLLELGLTQFESGTASLDANSAFNRNAKSDVGIEALQSFAQALHASLASGLTALPDVAPEAKLDLHAFFTSPPDPNTISDPLFEARRECDGTDCYSQVEIGRPFLYAFFRDIMVDWDGDYDVATSESMSDALEEIFATLRKKSFMIDD